MKVLWVVTVLPVLALCACTPPPAPPPDASPDAAAEAAADVTSAPDAGLDAAELPDVVSLPDVTIEASSLDVVDVVSRPDATADALPDADPPRPPLSFVADEQQYWVLYESYPGDGMGTPVVRTAPLMPSASRIANGTAGDRTIFSFRVCAAPGPNGCESIQLTQVPTQRVCAAGVCTDVSESNEICANPERAGVAQNCSARASSFAASPTYTDRLGRRRVNFCWTAALAADPGRPAIWAVRGVAGRTTQATRGDFCVFGYPAP